MVDGRTLRARTIDTGPSEMMQFIAVRQNAVFGPAVGKMRKRIQAA
jgi:hypothetical protein